MRPGTIWRERSHRARTPRAPTCRSPRGWQGQSGGVVEERSSRHGPGGLPPERGGGFSPVCLRPLYYQLLMPINSVTISRINIPSPPLGQGCGGDEIRRNQGLYSGKRPDPLSNCHRLTQVFTQMLRSAISFNIWFLLLAACIVYFAAV